MSIISKDGGATITLQAGGLKRYQAGFVSPLYDPRDWLTSLFRSLKSYTMRNFDPRVWEIIFGYPDSNLLAELMPLPRPVIHFEIDDISNPVFGLGENLVQSEYDDIAHQVKDIEVQQHMVNFDVGVWTSAKSGGTTMRLTAYQALCDMFNGASARQVCREVTKGIEVREFTGGQFIKEEINDLDVYRVAGISLTVRVYSLHYQQQIPYIIDIIMLPELLIDGVIVLDFG